MKLQQIFDSLRHLRVEVELSTAQVAEMTDLMQLPTLVIEIDGTLSAVNELAADLLGFNPAYLRGTNFARLIDVECEPMHMLLARCRDPAFGSDIKATLRGRSGRRLQVSLLPLRDRAGQKESGAIMLVLKEINARGAVHYVKRNESDFQAFATRLMLGHEIELKRLASTLHDGIGQDLAMIKFTVEKATRHLAQNETAEIGSLLREAVQYLREATDEVRRISSDLWPSALTDLGLHAALEGHCRKFEAVYQNLRLEKSILLDESMIPLSLKAEMFRLAQEALANSATHAHASVRSTAARLIHRRGQSEWHECVCCSRVPPSL